MSVAHGLPLIFDVADPVTKTAILTAAEGIGSDDAKAGALGSLAERLPEPRRTEILERALTAAEGIGGASAKAGALGSLAERLPERLLERALTAAEGIGDDGDKADALGSLAERLPERLLERALTAAEDPGIGDDDARPARSAHCGAPAGRLLERALTAAEGIGDDDAKADALGSLAEGLPERLLERALTAAEGIGERRHQGRRARLTGGAPAGAAPDRDTGAGADGGRGDRQRRTPRPARSARWQSACRSAFWSGR